MCAFRLCFYCAARTDVAWMHRRPYFFLLFFHFYFHFHVDRRSIFWRHIINTRHTYDLPTNCWACAWAWACAYIPTHCLSFPTNGFDLLACVRCAHMTPSYTCNSDPFVIIVFDWNEFKNNNEGRERERKKIVIEKRVAFLLRTCRIPLQTHSIAPRVHHRTLSARCAVDSLSCRQNEWTIFIQRENEVEREQKRRNTFCSVWPRSSNPSKLIWTEFAFVQQNAFFHTRSIPVSRWSCGRRQHKVPATQPIYLVFFFFFFSISILRDKFTNGQNCDERSILKLWTILFGSIRNRYTDACGKIIRQTTYTRYIRTVACR